MSKDADLKALACGCAYYKNKFEEKSQRVVELEASLHSLESKGYAVATVVSPAEIENSCEFRDINQRNQDYISMSEKEKEQLSNESKVLLQSMTKVSAELSQAVEANQNLVKENDALKAENQKMLNERLSEQKESSSELIKNKDIASESKLALEKQNKLIEDLTAKNEELQKLESYKKMYEDEHSKVSKLESDLDVLKRSAAQSSVVTDDSDDDLLIN